MGKSCCFFGSSKMSSAYYSGELTDMSLTHLIAEGVDTFYYCNENQK